MKKSAPERKKKKSSSQPKVHAVESKAISVTAEVLPPQPFLSAWAMRGKETVKMAGPMLMHVSQSQQRIIAWVRRKKNERLTIMLMPHDRGSTRNYHISNLTLIIITSILGIILLVSALLVIRHSSTIQEVDKLRVSHKDAEVQFAKVRQEIIDLSKSYEDIRQNLSSLQALSTEAGKSSGKTKDNFAEELAELQKKTSQIKDPEKIPLEIFLMNRMLHDMEISRGSLGQVQDYLKKRDRMLKNTPTLWPVQGYII
ncbi:MAG TPA: hypothetical protein PLY93_12310, partial [Turneriella sp.]|nr:hypothetical protein [Turneriella sp.]